jgi:predicted Zn-dependent protease
MNVSIRRSAPRSLLVPENAPADDSRFLSQDACRAVANRFFAEARGGGRSMLTINSRWVGNIRWGRNRVSSGGDSRSSDFYVERTIRGAAGSSGTNSSDEAMIAACLRRAEERLAVVPESPEQYPKTPSPVLPFPKPTLWFDATYGLDAVARGRTAAQCIAQTQTAGLVSAGYLETVAQGAAVLDTSQLFRYYPITQCQYSITVRDPKSAGSGWAGVDFNDWQRIDANRLTGIAIDKCQRSRNPVAVEPGRYTAVLEPQAVCDLFSPILDRAMDRVMAEMGMGPFAAGGGNSKIGQRVLDDRMTVSADPMDPDCGFIPFDWSGEPYQHVNWIENGVLKDLSYNRAYGVMALNKDAALSNSRAYRLSMTGATATIDEMVKGVERGLLVTRFNNVRLVDLQSMLLSGTTRDGVWLIEKGKISKAVKNFRFTESPLFAFNNIQQAGTPQRVFRPDAPAVVPAITVRDFSFTALADVV